MDEKKLTLNTGDSLDDDWVTGLTLTGPACLKNWKNEFKRFIEESLLFNMFD